MRPNTPISGLRNAYLNLPRGTIKKMVDTINFLKRENLISPNLELTFTSYKTSYNTLSKELSMGVLEFSTNHNFPADPNLMWDYFFHELGHAASMEEEAEYWSQDSFVDLYISESDKAENDLIGYYEIGVEKMANETAAMLVEFLKSEGKWEMGYEFNILNRQFARMVEVLEKDVEDRYDREALEENLGNAARRGVLVGGNFSGGIFSSGIVDKR
jgi:hypothetical protein